MTFLTRWLKSRRELREIELKTKQLDLTNAQAELELAQLAINFNKGTLERRQRYLELQNAIVKKEPGYIT